jgi:hypothetical protein
MLVLRLEALFRCAISRSRASAIREGYLQINLLFFGEPGQGFLKHASQPTISEFDRGGLQVTQQNGPNQFPKTDHAEPKKVLVEGRCEVPNSPHVKQIFEKQLKISRSPERWIYKARS